MIGKFNAFEYHLYHMTGFITRTQSDMIRPILDQILFQVIKPYPFSSKHKKPQVSKPLFSHPLALLWPLKYHLLEMAKGSGSAIQASILVLALLCLLIHIEVADAALYNVGWTPNTARGWPNKKMKAGDVLGNTLFFSITKTNSAYLLYLLKRTI